MRKVMFIGMIFVSLMSFHLMAGTEIQNGGSGLVINGQVATFYSAKVKIIPDPIDDLDGLDSLKTEIRSLDIDPWTKVSLLKMITPSFKRKYYRVDPNSVSAEDIEAIKKEYQKITGIDSKEIALFGLTNIETKTTLLFPDFFKLSLVEKTTMLFHESMWLSKKISSYQEMIQLEYSFQQYLENRDLKSAAYFYQQLSEATELPSNWLLCTVLNLESAEYLRTAPAASNVKLGLLMNEDSTRYLSQILIATLKSGNNNSDNLKIQLILNLLADISKNDPFYFSKKVLLDYAEKTNFSGVKLTDRYNRIFASNQSSDTLRNVLFESKLLDAHFVAEQSSEGCSITIYDSEDISLSSLN